MKVLKVECDVDNYYEDFLYSGAYIETKEDEKLFIKAYSFVISELERMQWYPHEEYDPHAEYDLEVMLAELNITAEKSDYKIEIEEK